MRTRGLTCKHDGWGSRGVRWALSWRLWNATMEPWTSSAAMQCCLVTCRDNMCICLASCQVCGYLSNVVLFIQSALAGLGPRQVPVRACVAVLTRGIVALWRSSGLGRIFPGGNTTAWRHPSQRHFLLL